MVYLLLTVNVHRDIFACMLLACCRMYHSCVNANKLSSCKFVAAISWCHSIQTELLLT